MTNFPIDPLPFYLMDIYIRNRLAGYASNRNAIILKIWTSPGEDIADMREGRMHLLAPHWHAWIQLEDGTKVKLFFNKHRKKPHYQPRGWQRERM